MLIEVGQIITDGTCQWRVRNIKSGSGVPIGTITPRLQSIPEPGEIALDTGPLLSRAAYPDFWAYVQAKAPLVSEAEWQAMAAVQSSVGFYSTGDGSTTFRCPRLLDYQRGGLASEVGMWQGDAIREITGQIGRILASPVSGVFEGVTNHNSRIKDEGGYYAWHDIRFKASNVVPVADENRPKTVRFLYCVKAFDAATNQGLVDIGALAAEVAGKQNTLKFAVICETQPSGTPGGTFTAGAWRTRLLNNIQYDNIGVILTGNQFTLPAGVYEVHAIAPALCVTANKCRLQNVTDGLTIALGCSAAANSTYGTDSLSTVLAVFSVAEGKHLELQHYCNTTRAADGFGAATSISGINEIYSRLVIRKVG